MTDIHVRGLRHVYGDHVAIEQLDLDVHAGQAYALVGPNGGGKTTLFRILSTLMRPQCGIVQICGESVTDRLFLVRRWLGVVFQSPAVDPKLTVDENLTQQGALYGLRGADLAERKSEVLQHLGLSERRHDFVETLSGGLKRRVDLAKGILHHPRILLLDEPTTGLDPGARRDFWEYLAGLRADFGTTVLLTTHLLEEAEKAERIGILHQGKMVAEGRPDELKSELGSEWVVIETERPEQLATNIRERHSWDARVVDGRVRLEITDGRECTHQLLGEFPDEIQTLTIGKPTLEDVFISKTGHQYWESRQPI